MSNALERTGRRMDEALAKLRRDRSAVSSSPASSFDPPLYPASSTFPLILFERCVCAVFDLEWLMRFERRASGLYRAVESMRLHAVEGFIPGATQSRVLNVDEIEGSYASCPWCGDRGNSLYHCDCGAVVCGGRVKGNLFVCRDSCGSEWKMGPPAREIRVTEMKTPRDWQAPPRTATGPAPANSVTPARLLLSSGTALSRPKRG